MILDEIKQKFSSSPKNKASLLKTLDEEYRSWVIRHDGWYGVGVPVNKDMIISEQFSNAKLYTKEFVIGGRDYNILMLASASEELRTEFAVVCAQFVDPGENGEERKVLVENPSAWWERWRSLLGNSIQNKQTYSILGELLIYKHLFKKNESPEWRGADGSTHDIETTSNSYEVKSTISRYESDITINGQFQLQNAGKDLYLIFCRFEPSSLGISIDDAVDEAVKDGLQRERINSKLAKMGLEIGTSARAEKFKVLETRLYRVDENFPLITPDSFKENKMPQGIKQLTYKVDLANIQYKRITI